MSPAKKTGWAQLRVGLMAIVALIILGVLIFLLTGTQKLFADHVTVYTYMADSAALTVKAPVRINGILAGKIAKVALSGETAPRRIIRIDMEIEKNLHGGDSGRFHRGDQLGKRARRKVHQYSQGTEQRKRCSRAVKFNRLIRAILMRFSSRAMRC